MPRRDPSRPKGVWSQKKRLADGSVVYYGYYGRGVGTIRLGILHTAEYHAALAEALSRAPADGTIASLVYAYRASRAFQRLRPRTRADYTKHLDHISDQFGQLSLRAAAAPRMSEIIERWRDSLTGSPRQVDYIVAVLSLLFAWGVRKGKLTHNRAAGLEKIYKVDRSEIVWTDEQIEAFLKVGAEPFTRALIIGLETGISQGDLLRLTWSADQGETIDWRRGKNGTAFSVPVSPRLRACLDGVQKGDGLQILTRADGRSWDPKGNGFRDGWRLTCIAAGVAGVTFNDLRGTFQTRRREAGWTPEEVALCVGHPIAAERGAARSYANRLVIAKASAKRLFANHYGSDGERNLQTALQTAPQGQELSA